MLHIEIPTAYILLGGFAFVILLPIIVAGLIRILYRSSMQGTGHFLSVLLLHPEQRDPHTSKRWARI